ncbi:MAG: hypothetical protein AB2A00_31695 [Myxococcota bacterium]
MKTSRLPVPTFVALASLWLALQAPGCWCDPAVAERFNTFPSGLEGGAADYCAAWARAECDYASRCDPALFQGLGGQSGCADGMRTRCEMEHADLLASEAAGRVTYDTHHARGCVEQRGGRSCGGEEPTSCGLVFSGAVTLDRACRREHECAPGLFCSGGPDTCGLCVSRYGMDGPCWDASSCQTGLRCVEGRCRGLLAVGAACAETPDLCPDGTSCSPPIPQLAACTAPVGEGAACVTYIANFPIPLTCQEGLVCVGTTSPSCRRLAREGEGCDPQARTAPPCEDNGVRLFCDDDVCAPLEIVGEGSACGTGVICTADTVCSGGTCQRRPRAGEECSPGAQEPCFQSSCAGGLCVAHARVGEPCDAGCPGLECVSGRCGLGPCDGGMAWDAYVPPEDGGVGDAGP